MKHYQEISCPQCSNTEIIKAGKSKRGTQRYFCKKASCSVKTFMLEYRHKAYAFGVKKQIIDMAINASGIRDTARVLGINKNTVISTLKKRK
jgi:transposase-like protein